MDASEFAGDQSTTESECTGHGFGVCSGCGDDWATGHGSGWGSDCYGGGYLGDGSGYGYGTVRSVGYGYGTGSGPW
jgi:hypothetical protein